MPRNKDRFEYIEVSIPKDSDLYRLLAADAKRATQSLAQVMLVRLADYYGMVGQDGAPQPEVAPPEDKKATTKKQTLPKEKEPVGPVPTSSDLDDAAEKESPDFNFSRALAGAALFDQL